MPVNAVIASRVFDDALHTFINPINAKNNNTFLDIPTLVYISVEKKTGILKASNLSYPFSLMITITSYCAISTVNSFLYNVIVNSWLTLNHLF